MSDKLRGDSSKKLPAGSPGASGAGGAPPSRVHNAAPKPNRDDPVRDKVTHLPGNWNNPPGGNGRKDEDCNCSSGGNWRGPVGGNTSCPNGIPCLVGMGYHPDLPDWRDHNFGKLQEFLQSTRGAPNPRLAGLADRANSAGSTLPSAFNLGENSDHPLPPIENQGQTNSCTAQAAASMVEYLYRWATGQYNDFSRLFIYFNARKMLGWPEDSGAYIRTTFKAMRLFGVPPETEWPFDLSLINAPPLPYHYAYASNFKTIMYARLDGYTDEPADVCQRVKQTVFTGFPVEFGFPVYSCIQNMQNHVIPVPTQKDRLLGGHAVLAVGYDDGITYTDDQGVSQKGALIIRNSWGVDWGDQGYGFLPYWYIKQGYASDFWTAYDKEWLDLDKFS